jgi:3-hydroxypropionyl-CoA synthetase (ADP-forming)
VGPCVVAIDFIEESNVELAELSEQSLLRLKTELPEYCIISNPIDLTGSADASMYRTALDILGEDPNVDIILPFFVFQDAPLASTVNELHKIIEDTQKYGKTLIGVAAGGRFTRTQIRTLQKIGIPVIPTPRRVINALSKITEYSRWLAHNQSKV